MSTPTRVIINEEPFVPSAFFEHMLLYLIGRIWLLAHRGSLDDDPLIVALKDPQSSIRAVCSPPLAPEAI